MELADANKDGMLQSSSKIFRQFRNSPYRNFGCVSKSFRAIRPVLKQAFLFGYIFAFHLPSFMVQFLVVGSNKFLLRGALRAAYGRASPDPSPQESLASTLGPGVIEVDTKTLGGEHYGKTVIDQTCSYPERFWQTTAYYRDGLHAAVWTKSLETLADLHNLESESSAASSPTGRRRSSSSASSALFGETYKGSLKAPTTILWGDKDFVMQRGLFLDGIGDYLAKGSEVIILPRTGHWTSVQKEGRAAVAAVVAQYARNDRAPPLYVAKDVAAVYDGASVMVKK